MGMFFCADVTWGGQIHIITKTEIIGLVTQPFEISHLVWDMDPASHHVLHGPICTFVFLRELTHVLNECTYFKLYFLLASVILALDLFLSCK